jgi:lysophospholipase L1-like esterase
MPVALRYIGAEERFFEVAITGQQQGWFRGQTSTVSDVNAPLLLATGKFERAAPSASGTVGTAALKQMLLGAQPRPFASEKFIATIPDWTAKTYNNLDCVKSNGYMFAVWSPVISGNDGTLVSTVAPSNTTSTKPVADPGDTQSATTAEYRGWLCLGPVRTDTEKAAELVSYTKSTSAPSLGFSCSAASANLPFNRAGLDQWSAAGFYYLQSGVYLVPYAYFKDARESLQGPGYTSLTFYTDETTFGWDDRQPQFLAGQDAGFSVDGVEYHPTSPFQVAVGERFRTLTFANKKWRKITIRPAILQNWYAQSQDAIFIPAQDELSLSWLAVGDSYFEGSGDGPVLKNGYTMAHCARELGLPYPVLNAAGGTGFLQTNGSQKNYLDRLKLVETEYKARAFKFAFVYGSGNDQTPTVNGAYRQRVFDTLAYLRTLLPSPQTPIFQTLVISQTGNVDATITLRNDEIKAAVAALNDPYIYIIAMDASAPGGISPINSRNLNSHIGALQGHPMEYGSMYLGKYFAQQIKRIALAA